MKLSLWWWWRWLVKAGLLLGLLIGAGWLGQGVQTVRAERDLLNQALTKLPEQVSAEATQHMVLIEQRTAVERLQRLLPQRQAVGTVASVLEREGGQRQVAVVITGFNALRRAWRNSNSFVLSPFA